MNCPAKHCNEEETCEQKVYRKINRDLGIKREAKSIDLGLSEDSVTFLDEEDEGGANMIVCSNGNCKFLNTHFVLDLSNKYWGEGEEPEGSKCMQRPQHETKCNGNGMKDSSNEKVSISASHPCITPLPCL